MNQLTHDWIGAIHLWTAVLAFITGSLVLAMRKGTNIHRKIGYVYAASMAGVVITAFLIYRLFGGFGIFHVAAIISFITLAGGMLPVLLRKPEDWLPLHFSFMYWSVMGLYAAFVAEVMVRIPASPFFGTIGPGTMVVMIVGGIMFYYRKDRWEEQFKSSSNA